MVNSLSSPGQGMPGFSGTHGNTEKKTKDIIIRKPLIHLIGEASLTA